MKISLVSMVRFLAPGILVVALLPAATAQPMTPDALVRGTTTDIIGVLKKEKDAFTKDPKRIYELVDAKVLPHFNFTRMTQLAVGKHWNSASPTQRDALTKEFRTLLVRTYSSALELYKDQSIDVRALVAPAADNEVTVKTQINHPGGQPIPMDYRMERTASGWKVFDVTVEGVSIVTTYRSQFNTEVGRTGVDGLIKSLSEKNARLDAQSRTAQK